MNQSNEYYYNLLTKQQQKAYYMIKEGLLELRDSFPVLLLSPKEISDIYSFVRLDHPEIFWSVSYSYKYYTNSSDMILTPKYLFHKDKIREHIKAIDARVKKLCKPADNFDDENKVLYIHDFICSHVKYDKLKKEYSHEIIGPLVNGVAVCEGMAKAVKILCDYLDIWCVVIISDSNPEKGIPYRHAWNVVKIDNLYYHMDATFDNNISKSGTLRRDYFRLTDQQIYSDHEPSMWEVPKCQNENLN